MLIYALFVNDESQNVTKSSYNLWLCHFQPFCWIRHLCITVKSCCFSIIQVIINQII